VRRNPLLVDVGIAALLAVVVLILAPGLAVVGMLAILVLLIAGALLVRDARRRKRGPRAPAASRRTGRARSGASSRRR
jgi:hypothetical protein